MSNAWRIQSESETLGSLGPGSNGLCSISIEKKLVASDDCMVSAHGLARTAPLPMMPMLWWRLSRRVLLRGGATSLRELAATHAAASDDRSWFTQFLGAELRRGRTLRSSLRSTTSPIDALERPTELGHLSMANDSNIFKLLKLWPRVGQPSKATASWGKHAMPCNSAKKCSVNCISILLIKLGPHVQHSVCVCACAHYMMR